MDTVLTGKKVVVTGGAGFIGSNLCEAFLNQGNKVVCYDNLVTGFRHNVEHLSGEFEFIEGDICDFNKLVQAFSGADVVIHQAALGSVPRSINDPLATNHVNITGFLTVLEAAKQSGIKRVVYASSSSVYGDIMDSPKTESKIGKQLSPYAVSKYSNELYAGVFNELYDLELIGLRYFNVFGKRQTPEGPYAAAIPRFVAALIKGESPVVYGDGNQTRDFTHIDNVIRANNLAATTQNKTALGQVFNVACGETVTINDVLKVLMNELEAFVPNVGEIQIKHDSIRIGDVRSSLASIEKAGELLGYEPVMYFEDGIRQAIKWYYSNLA